MNQAIEIKNIDTAILRTIHADGGVRLDALKEFEKSGLPTAKSEEYKFTPIKKTLEKNFEFGASNKPASFLTDLESFSIKGLNANTIVLLNGKFSQALSSLNSSKIKIEIIGESQLPLKVGSLANFKTDPLVAWNTATFKEVVHIQVDENIREEKPIVIHHIHDTSQGEVKSFNRVLIELGKNSTATVIEKLNSVGKKPGFSNSVTEGFISENAELNYYSIQADDANRYHFSQTSITQDNNSRVNCFTLILNGKLIRNNLQLVLDGEGCESHLNGLYLVQGDTLVDNHTVVDHKKPHSYSNELYKGVIDEKAKGVFNGKIFVRPHAQKTNAFQSNRNIILSDNATVNTKPQLEIWADDVKCSHGCTTGQLDEEAIFYLQSRGIDKGTAQAMVLYAFAGEVLNTVKSETLKNYFDTLISERLHKNF